MKDMKKFELSDEELDMVSGDGFWSAVIFGITTVGCLMSGNVPGVVISATGCVTSIVDLVTE